jgi:hypothetical protein
MGSWNTTCMISNLPILWGDKVKLFFLSYGTEPLAGSSFCYANGMLTPAFLAISAKYSDYGSVEEIVEDWNYNLIVKAFKERYKKIKVQEEKVLEDFTLLDIIKGIERTTAYTDGLLIMRNKGIMQPEDTDFQKSELCFVMIRQDVWDGICAEHKGEFRNPNDIERAEGKYFISAQESCRKKFDKSMSSLKKIEEINELVHQETDSKKRIELMVEGNMLSDDLIFKERGEQGGLTLGRFLYLDYLREQEFDKEAVFKAWSEHRIIHDFLECTRKSWMIPQGAGSQSQNWNSYQMLNKLVDKICVKEAARWGDEEEEFEG